MSGLRIVPTVSLSNPELTKEKLCGFSEARKRVGADLKFIDERLPSPANLPDAHALLEWHRDLIAAGS